MRFPAFDYRRAFIPAVLILTVFAEVFLFTAILNYCSGLASKAETLPALSVCLVAATLLIMTIWRFKGNPETVFLLLAVPMGVALALFMLPDQVPDERWHIYRAIDLKIFGGGTTVPSIIGSAPVNYSEYRNALCIDGAWSSTVWFERDLTNYFIHLYIVANVAFTLLRIVDINPFIAVIVARIANGAVFVAVGYLCIKKMPHAKVMFTIFMLNPLLLQQEFSISADSIVNTVSLAFVTYLFWMKFEKHLEKGNFVILALLAVLTSISKIAYAPMVLLILILVPYIASEKVQRLIYGVVAGGIVLVSAIVIATYRNGTYQMMFELVRNPVELVSVLLKSVYELTPFWVESTFGMLLGSVNIGVWEPCFWLYLGILGASATYNLGEEYSFSRVEKILINLFGVGLFVVILLVLREWSVTVDKRSDVIMGFQGRYLIPFIFPSLSCAVTSRSSLYRKNSLFFYSMCLCFIYTLSLVAVFYRFI